MKCGSLLDSISDEQMVGRHITLCPRDALYEKNIPEETKEEEDF